MTREEYDRISAIPAGAMTERQYGLLCEWHDTIYPHQTRERRGEFAAAWRQSSSLYEVAWRLSMEVDRVADLAAEYRNTGMGLRFFGAWSTADSSGMICRIRRDEECHE